ncbi:BglG family transcription antiterminator [Enterococcus sp. AZ072]|uniref:BglG family transcription antiterminator n=1 Tax=unclassified Enterococcus TaxID=2608891 RepID=UPI003D2B7AF8
MNQTLNRIIDLLLQSNQPVSSARLAESVGVSQRTIKRYMKEIPDSLLDVSFNIQSDKNGYQLNIGQADRIKLSERLVNTDETQDRIEEEANLFMYLVLKGEATIDNMADHFFYSKNTIVKKIELLRQELSEYKIEITRSNRGLVLAGSESNIRRAILIFLRLEDPECQQLIDDYFQEKDFTGQIYQLLIDELIAADISFSQEQIHLIFRNILIALIRIPFVSEEQYQEEDVLIYKNYIVVMNLDRKIQEKFKLHPNQSDLFYLSVLFGNIMFTEEKEREIRMSFFYALEKLDKQYNEVFLDNSRITNNLWKHVMISIQHLTFGIFLQNPLKDMIKKKYFLAYEYATFFSNELSKLLKITFSDEEISYFALHFQTYLEEMKEEEVYRAIVVCENGVGTSSLVRMQLEARFYNLKIKKVIPRYLAEQQNYEDIDFIISTHHLDAVLPKEVIYVNAVLTDQDFKTINNFLRSSMSTSYLKSLFHEELFFSHAKLKNRGDVLGFISDILIEKNLLKENERDQIIERENYAATDILPGVAIPHYVTKEKTFFFFVKLEQPILWSTENVSYILFGGINVQERESKKIFPYLVKKFQKEEFRKRIDQMDSFEELLQILNEG